MEELINQYRYLVGGYYGICFMDDYPLKEYILKEIEDTIKAFEEIHAEEGICFLEEAKNVKDTVSEKVKLQDALLVLNRIEGPMDLVFMIKERLKKYSQK